MDVIEARFDVGELVHHRKFDYRGVVVRVDPAFALSEEWYERVAVSRPPREAPWYQVLVDESEDLTYVAERHLEQDRLGLPVRNPMVGELLGEFRDGRYEDETERH